MGQRYIGRFARLDAKADTHQIGGHFVQSGCFCVHSDVAARMRLRDPFGQRFGVADAGVCPGAHCGGFWGFGRVWGCDFGGGRGFYTHAIGDALGQGAEFHLIEEFQQILRHGVADFERF